MSSLIVDPYALVQGNTVLARLVAVNSIGASIPSSVNSVGALVELVPQKPPVAPTKNAATTQNSLVIDYIHLEGTAVGGTQILSYEV
jgi:hypothetical protein